MDNALIRHGMIDDLNEMVRRLSCAIALEQDAPLQAKLARKAGAAHNGLLTVLIPKSEAWLSLGAGRSPRVHRDAPLGIIPIKFEELARRDGAIGETLTAAIDRTQANDQAAKLLGPFFDLEPGPTRAQMRDLLKWAPVLEQVAYRYTARTTTLLDRLRPELLTAADEPSAARDQKLLEYWSLLHTGGHFSLLASSAEARPWLTGMAQSFTWETWTPTFPLLRERTLWLAAVGARSAVAFGEPVIEPYLTALALANHPLRTMDALCGLVAIALDQERTAPAILAELVKARDILSRQTRSDGPLMRVLIDSAIQTLREPQRAARELIEDWPVADHWSQKANGLLNTIALRLDPTEVLPSKSTVGLIALPVLAAMGTAAYYPEEPTRELAMPPQVIAAILSRAWGAGSQSQSAATLH